MASRMYCQLLGSGAVLLAAGMPAMITPCTTASAQSAVARDRVPSRSALAVPAPGPELIAEALHLVETLGEDAWPGFSRTKAPFLYIAGEREYAVGFPRPLEGFEEVAGATIAGRSVQEGPRLHRTDLAASFPVSGVDAVVIGTPEALDWSPTQWTLKAVHEIFHVFQQSHGWEEKVAALEIGPRNDAGWQLDFPFPYEDPDISSLLHQVSYPTFLAIEAPSVADVVSNAGVALEALSVLNEVLLEKTGDERAERYMRFQEATEGVAKYVERRVAEAAASGEYEPTTAFRALPGFVAYAELWEDQYRGQIFLVKHAGRVAKSRTEFYHLGLGKCLLLDRLDETWKERYFDARVWLPDLIEESVRACEESDQ